MSAITGVLAAVVIVLVLANIYQFLVRRDGKDVEIIEAHLFDMATSARSILRALGRSEDSLGPDPALTVGTNGNRMSSDSLLRLADNIFFAVSEENPGASWDDLQTEALERFRSKEPNMEPEAARKIVTVVAHRFQKESNGKKPLAVAHN